MASEYTRIQDIDAVYRLWNFYRSLGITYKKDWLTMGVPQSLGYLQRRLSVNSDDIKNRAIEVTGLPFWGTHNINHEGFNKG